MNTAEFPSRVCRCLLQADERRITFFRRDRYGVARARFEGRVLDGDHGLFSVTAAS